MSWENLRASRSVGWLCRICSHRSQAFGSCLKRKNYFDCWEKAHTPASAVSSKHAILKRENSTSNYFFFLWRNFLVFLKVIMALSSLSTFWEIFWKKCPWVTSHCNTQGKSNKLKPERFSYRVEEFLQRPTIINLTSHAPSHLLSPLVGIKHIVRRHQQLPLHLC